jgi:hypothetical protein
MYEQKKGKSGRAFLRQIYTMECQWKSMLTEDYAIVKDQIAPCGIRCGECPLGNGTVSETAMELSKYLQRYEVASWAHEIPGGGEVDFKLFEQNLNWVRNSLKCPGCLNGGGSSECPIRVCSKMKGYFSCSQCAELRACDKFDWLGEKGERQKSELDEGL